MSPQPPLKICLATAEMTPLAKTGGLADVTAALTGYFTRTGHDVRALLPLYGGMERDGLDLQPLAGLQNRELQVRDRLLVYSVVRVVLPGQEVDVHLLDCPQLYRGEQIYSGPEEQLRFILLSRAAIEMCQHMAFAPDIFHCHDWHCALIPLYLKTLYAWDRLFRNTRSVLTLHNIGYQGVFGAAALADAGLADSAALVDQDDLLHDRLNFLKTGIVHADLLTTVSPTYAREILSPEYGMGLEQALRARSDSLVGILNGVDYGEWNPEHDPLIHHPYSARKLSGKEKNKQALAAEMGLEYQHDRPLIGMITRLTYQKGIDLVQQVLPEVLDEREFSVAVLGSGEPQHEEFLHWLQAERPGRVSFHPGYNNALAHRIEAGSDLFLMPSRYEPCGLNQMYSLRYGTIPVVRATGGLADSVQHFDSASGAGTGVVFHDFDANGLKWALNTALDLYANKHDWRQLMANAMAKNFSWERQGGLYVERFRRLLGDRG
ncbi:MAG: glycogen/starch synthase [Xanthomonadales bacterium]|nr:glycogen/starch synthase [Xanthomonadales bacterium]